jgi:hypothetical protein
VLEEIIAQIVVGCDIFSGARLCVAIEKVL